MREYECEPACQALAALGPVAKVAVPNLIAALHDRRENVRRAATLAIGEMGAEGRTAIPAILELLRDADESIRRAAIVALGRIGPEARATVPTLRQIRDHENNQLVQDELDAALRLIEPAPSSTQ